MLSAIKFRAEFVWVAVIVAAAVLMRTFRPGLENLIWDELNVMFWAMQIADHGRVLWVSNNVIGWSGASWNPIQYHSAMSNYTLALFYTINGSPLWIRLAAGLLGAASVLLTYAAVRRHVGGLAANLGGVMFAFSAVSADVARRVVNPNLALFSLGVWVYTALAGYYAGKRWAMAVHWVALALAIQYQPANVMLFMPSAMIAAVRWWQHPDQRRAWLAGTAAGVLLAALTGLPWLAGNVFAEQLTGGMMVDVVPPGDVDSASADHPGVVALVTDAGKRFFEMTTGTHYRPLERGYVNAPLFPPHALDALLYGMGAVGLIGAAVMLVRRGTPLPHVFFAALTLLPLVVTYGVAYPQVHRYYFYNMVYGFFPVMGIALAWLWRHFRWGRPVALALVSVFVVMQVWLTVGTVRYANAYGWNQPLTAPLDVYRALVREWAAETGAVVIAVDTDDAKFARPEAQRYFWSVVGHGYPLHVINRFNGQGLPVAPMGTLVVSLSEGATVPRVGGAAVVREGAAWQWAEPVFQRVVLHPDSLPTLTHIPVSYDRFGNGAQMRGAWFEAAPHPDTPLPLTLVWQPQRPADQDYQFSVRLVDADGTTYGQRDFRSLDLALWRVGDVVINPADIPVSAAYVPGTPLQIQVIMYRYADTQAVDVVDAAGNVVAPWLFLQPTN